MHSVGFEPTNANIADLKSAPLDHSGNYAKTYTYLYFPAYYILPSYLKPSNYSISSSYIFLKF